MRVGVLFRLYVLWGFVVVTSSLTKPEKKKGTGRRSRQVFEAEGPEGVWSPWGEWSECSQSCGVGVSQRTRKCSPPPPPPLSHAPLNWAGSSFLPSSSSSFPHGGVGGPVISAMHPFYPPHYPGHQPAQYGVGGGGPERQPPPYYSSALSTNQSPGLPLFRNTPAGGREDDVSGQSNPLAPLYGPDFSPANQEQPPVSVYRSPSFPAASHGYSQPTRVSRRPANPSAVRAGGGGNRRSVSTNREAVPAKRPSIRPGQFGYGRVPFSMPLHRPNRQARHTANGNVTTATPGPDPAERDADTESPGEERREEEEEEREEANGREEERGAAEESTESPVPTTATTPAKAVRPERQTAARRQADWHGRGREGEREGGRATHGSHAQRAFDWHAVTAPPPRPHPPALSRPYYSPLHRPPPPQQQREREPHPGYGPQAPRPGPPPQQPGVYALQHSQPAHLGPEEERGGGGAGGGGAEGGHTQSYSCSGGDKEYRKCFSQVCGGGVVDSRAQQCAAFNTQEFMGRLYDWEPFTEVGVDKQCELTCRPAGYRFYVRQSETVRDGTPCVNTSTNDVCVGGQCLSDGCDGVLGSGRVVDTCGVCGGRNASCRKVSGSFQNTSVPLGYHKILDIPPGATAINITERRASSNYLAMRSGTGASVVNGRWAVDPPGEYQAGGTTFTYARPRAHPDGQDEKGETLTAPGPTTTLLQLYIIFHRQNPGIDYDFYVPVEKKEGERERERQRPREREGEAERPGERDGGWRAPLRGTGTLTVTVEDPIPPPPISVSSSSSSSSSSSTDRWTPERSRPRGSAPNRNARIPPRTDLPPDTQPPFVWRRGRLTECTASCGKGSQYRLVLCVSRHTDEEVPERKCDSAAKPTPEDEPCNTHPCPPFWEVSAWSECSVSCGQGVQQRQLQCRQSFGNRSTMVHPQRCAALTPPDASQACQLRLCSHWEVSTDWSTCSVDCGVGKRTRNVRCVSDHGNVVSDRECNTRLRPRGSEECHMGPCVTNWYFTDWLGTCSAQCGPGVQKREVLCLTRGGGRGGGGGEGGGGGDCVGDKPADMKACNGGPCVPTHMWYSSPWTQCSAPCGSGSQRRDVICVWKLGSDFSVAPAEQCAHLDKPPAVQECEMEPCRPQWFTTEWSACSRSCGKGLQMREVRCLSGDKHHSPDCDPATRPEQEQLCNTIPCGPLVTDENCRDRRHNCVTVVQARLCVYSYYKTACCASCTQSAQRAKRH